MHCYIEKTGDNIVKEFHPNGKLASFTVLNNNKQANGWSRKKFDVNGLLEEEENFSHQLLIEKINYNSNKEVISHQIWNYRLKTMVPYNPISPYPKPNVITGYLTIGHFFKYLPTISEFIKANYDEALLLDFFNSSSESGLKETTWKLQGDQMSFSIYWDSDEVYHQWHCHCQTEELYLEARKFLTFIN